MNRSTVISFFAAVVTLFALSFLFSGTPDNVGLFASLDPVNAVINLAFTFSFAAGVPSVAATVVAIAVFAFVPGAVFLIARRLLRRCDG